MATQYASLQPTPAPYKPPHLTIAYVAGPATVAVNDALADMPADTRDSTLDDLPKSAKAQVGWIIEEAQDRLSPAMHHAFLGWFNACLAVEAARSDDGEDEIDTAADRHSDALHVLTITPALNADDLHLKSHVWALNDSRMNMPSSLGPLAVDTGQHLCISNYMAGGVSADLLAHSELSRLIDQFARTLRKSPDVSETLPIVAVRDQSPWGAQYRAFLETKAERDKYAVEHLNPASRFHLELAEAGFDTKAAVQLVNRHEDAYGGLVSKVWRSLDGLLRLPAPSLAALNLALNLVLEEDAGAELEGEHAKAVSESIDRFCSGNADSMLLNAFGGCQDEMRIFLAQTESSQAEDDAADARVDEHEDILHTTPALTIEGIVAKLRIVFQHVSTGPWTNHAILDPSVPEFVEGLNLAGMFEQMLWSAIDDLARIGGISLKDQDA